MKRQNFLVRMCVEGCLLMFLLLSCSHAAKPDQAGATKATEDSLSQMQAEPEEGEPAEDDDEPGLSGYEQDLKDLSELPETAQRMDSFFQYAVYVNVEQKAANEGEEDAVYSVWLADERAGTVFKVCQTNPTASAQWEKMKGEDADAVDVPLQLIATASRAYLAPGDVSKVIVEGSPDARNVWTYIIDTNTHTAKQFPTTEGVVERDWNKKEIILASYGYFSEGGRYTFNRAYSLDGKFLRVTSDKEME